MARPQHRLTDDEKQMILLLYELGQTDEQIARAMKLPRRTFMNILAYNGITATIKKEHKGIADVRVEASLYNQAVGGNTTACIFWLCNRQAERWRTVQTIKHEGNFNGEMKVEIVGVDIRKAWPKPNNKNNTAKK